MTFEIDVFWDTILVYEAIFVVENGEGDTGEEEETRET